MFTFLFDNATITKANITFIILANHYSGGMFMGTIDTATKFHGFFNAGRGECVVLYNM